MSGAHPYLATLKHMSFSENLFGQINECLPSDLSPNVKLTHFSSIAFKPLRIRGIQTCSNVHGSNFQTSKGPLFTSWMARPHQARLSKSRRPQNRLEVQRWGGDPRRSWHCCPAGGIRHHSTRSNGRILALKRNVPRIARFLAPRCGLGQPCSAGSTSCPSPCKYRLEVHRWGGGPGQPWHCCPAGGIRHHSTRRNGRILALKRNVPRIARVLAPQCGFGQPCPAGSTSCPY